MDFKYPNEYLGWLYYQYLLITGIYVLEPWEQSIFNSVLFSSMAMVIYTPYVFVPVHVRLAIKLFCGEQPETCVYADSHKLSSGWIDGWIAGGREIGNEKPLPTHSHPRLSRTTILYYLLSKRSLSLGCFREIFWQYTSHYPRYYTVHHCTLLSHLCCKTPCLFLFFFNHFITCHGPDL